ncbi:MAG TPA: hypothetical protein VFM37_12855, partial [Pseudonocardiaceae bacterium]|nr:hypothetical protein [Pseudonocardiaceae bacterium]
MYELSRVRLFSVGPAGARYADVMLDFRDVGAPVRTSMQDALFGAALEVRRRPAPASVLFLENGGGKSVLIKLIFSVMLPGRRQVVGTTSTRVLEKFVRAGDVAHVVLEWQHIDTGTLVVTGKVSEWRGHVVSSDPNKLVDAWYSFRPNQRLTLDTLPLTVDGRLVTLTGFRERLTEASREEPALQVAWEAGHADWTSHLGNLGIDTELFRYQRAMNAGEGEAADTFTFKTDDAFVDFLLRAVVDEEDPRGLAEVIEGYAHRLSQRGALTAERDFVAGALERLAPLADAHEQALTARRLADDARARAARFYTAVSLRHAIELERHALAQARLADLVDREQDADRTVARLGSVVLELRRLVAGMRLRAAEADAVERKAELEHAELTLEAWRATDAVLLARSTADKASALRHLVGQQEERARPALEARNAAARALARGLLHTAAEADRAAANADAAADSLREQEGYASTEREEQLKAAATQRANAKGFERQIAEARAAMQRQTRAGLLPDGADTAQVAREAELATLAATEAEDTLEAARHERERLAAIVRDAGATLNGAERAADLARGAAEQAATTANQATAAVASLRAEERLIEILGAETIEPDADIPELVELLTGAITEADREATEIGIADAEDSRALAALGEGGLLPPPHEVTGTVDALAAAGITAWPGWRYLSTIAPDERHAVLDRYPHLVDGVVINDPAQLALAERTLADARLLPRSVVAVGTTAAIHAGNGARPVGLAFLVPPNPAMYDEDAAEHVRATIGERHHRNQQRLAELTEQRSSDRELKVRLTRFRSDYPPGTVDRLVVERDAAQARQQEAMDEVERRAAAHESARASEAEQVARIPVLHATEQQLRARAGVLVQLASQVAELGTWLLEVAKAMAAAAGADEAATAAGRRALRLRDDAEAQRRLADAHRRTADACREELAGVLGGGSVDDSEPVPAAPLEALRRAWRAAAEAYAKVEVGSDLRAELEQAERAESGARTAIEALSAEIRTLATELIATPAGADAPARAAATRRAEHDLRRLRDLLELANQRVGELRNEFEQFTPQDRSLEPYGRPETIEHGEALIARVHSDWEAAREQLDEIKKARADATGAVDQAEAAARGFHSVLESLHGREPVEPDPSVTAFEGDVDAAR